MLAIAKGRTAGSISKFLTPPAVKRAFGKAQGSSNTGSKKDGWTDVPPHHVQEDGDIISLGMHTHCMNAPNLKLWIEKIVHPAHEAASACGNPDVPNVPLDPKTTFSISHIDA